MNAFYLDSSGAGNEERLEVESNMLGDLQSELRRQSPPDTNASPNLAQSVTSEVELSMVANDGSSRPDIPVSAAKIARTSEPQTE